jgi:hypothetical protein
MPKTCPKCQTLNGGFAQTCACGFDLSGVEATGLPTTPTPARPVGPAAPPISLLVGLAGCVLAAIGALLPLVSVEAPPVVFPGGQPTPATDDRSWYTFPGIGNAVLALAVGGGVLLLAGSPAGAAAAGAALVAFALPVPGQVKGGTFGWTGWLVVIAGGALLAGAGVAGLVKRRERGEPKVEATA